MLSCPDPVSENTLTVPLNFSCCRWIKITGMRTEGVVACAPSPAIVILWVQVQPLADSSPHVRCAHSSLSVSSDSKAEASC